MSKEHLAHLVELEQPPAKPGAGPLRRFAKRVHLRMLRPYTAYQQRVNLSAATGIDENAAAVTALRAETGSSIAQLRAETHQRIDGIEASLAETRQAIQQLRADLAGALADVSAESRSTASRVEALEAASKDAEAAGRLLEDASREQDEANARLSFRTRELRARVTQDLVNLAQAVETLRDQVNASRVDD